MGVLEDILLQQMRSESMQILLPLSSSRHLMVASDVSIITVRFFEQVDCGVYFFDLGRRKMVQSFFWTRYLAAIVIVPKNDRRHGQHLVDIGTESTWLFFCCRRRSKKKSTTSSVMILFFI
ncbi:hypothetical protein DSUL_20553 [Desulfovibrionales bacterium]